MALCESSNFSLAEFYLNLGRKLLQPTGSTSQLISVQLKGSEEPHCLSFWWISSVLCGATRNRHVGYQYGPQLAPCFQTNADKIHWNKTKRPCSTHSPLQTFCHSRSKSGVNLLSRDFKIFPAVCTPRCSVYEFQIVLFILKKMQTKAWCIPRVVQL